MNNLFFVPTGNAFEKIIRTRESYDHGRFTEEYYDDMFRETKHSLRREIHSCGRQDEYPDRVQWVSEERVSLNSLVDKDTATATTVVIEYRDTFVLGALDSLLGITKHQINREALFQPPGRSWCTWRWKMINPKDQAVYYVDLCHDPITKKFACIGGISWVAGSENHVLSLVQTVLGPQLCFCVPSLGCQHLGRVGIITSGWSSEIPEYITKFRGWNVLHGMAKSLTSPQGLPLQLLLWKHENSFSSGSVHVTLMRFVGKYHCHKYPCDKDLVTEGFFEAPRHCNARTLCERMGNMGARLMKYDLAYFGQSDSGYEKIRDIRPEETLESVCQMERTSPVDSDQEEEEDEDEDQEYLEREVTLVWCTMHNG